MLLRTWVYKFLHGYIIFLGYIPRSGIVWSYAMIGVLDCRQRKLPLALLNKEEIISKIVEASRIHKGRG